MTTREDGFIRDSKENARKRSRNLRNGPIRANADEAEGGHSGLNFFDPEASAQPKETLSNSPHPPFAFAGIPPIPHCNRASSTIQAPPMPGAVLPG